MYTYGLIFKIDFGFELQIKYGWNDIETAAALMMCQFSKTCLNKRISPEEVFDGIKFLTVSNISLNVVERMLSHKRIRSVIKNRLPNHVSFTQVSSKSGV